MWSKQFFAGQQRTIHAKIYTQNLDTISFDQISPGNNVIILYVDAMCMYITKEKE